MRFGRSLFFALALFALCVPASASAQDVPAPMVTGPIEGGSHGYPWNHTLYSLSGKNFDYTENEYFYSGTAQDLSNGTSAPYTSRMLVRLPSRKRDFSGAVLVEWLNVTSQSDFETAWPVEAQWLMRHGIGYVGVSAQMAGVCCANTTLQGWDMQRYGPLLHPGDNFSYDIYSQATRALRGPQPEGSVDPLAGFRLRKLITTGASQSASRLTDFVNDGYNRGQIDLYVITRGGGPYDDFSTPIFQINEENNEVPQPDGPNYVAWEEGGAAHAPTPWWDYITAEQNRDLGVPNGATAINTGCQPINRASVDFTSRAMSLWVNRYLRDGTMPPSAPRVERDDLGNIVRDDNGLAVGGLRQPFVQVPIAFNSSEKCPLFGTHEDWNADKITSLYATHHEYVVKLRRRTFRQVKRGFLIPGDRRRVIKRAKAFTAPWAGGCDPCVAPRGL